MAAELDLGPIEERLDKAEPLFQTKFFKNKVIRDHTFIVSDYEEIELFERYQKFLMNTPADIVALVSEVKRLREVEEELRDRIDQMEYTCEH